jgi:hypothetical protein
MIKKLSATNQWTINLLLKEERILLVQTPMILDEIYDIIVLFNKSNFLKVT